MNDFNLSYATRRFAEITGQGLTIAMHYSPERREWEVHYNAQGTCLDITTFDGTSKDRPYMDVLLYAVRNVLMMHEA